MAGGWSNTSTDEITAPGTVPFLPGNDVVGIGTQVPAELVAAGYKNAIIFYSTKWNPAATVPTIKFRFIATSPTSGDLILGYGICANPSVSQTAVVTTGLDLNLQGIVAPGGATYKEGNNVIGLGAQLPAELTAAGYVDALVFYSTAWNPAATTFTIKFRFISVTGDSLIMGYGYCANPSVSQVATIASAFSLSLNTGLNDTQLTLLHANGTSMFSITGVNADVILEVYGSTGGQSVTLEPSGDAGFINLGASTGNGFFQFGPTGGGGDFLIGSTIGGITLENANLNGSGVLKGFGGWTAIPVAGSWSNTDFTRIAQYRMMPDGTVQFQGQITSPFVPANGETWMSGLPAAFCPLQPVEFLVPCGDRAYLNSSNGPAARIYPDGHAVIFDAASTLSGDIVLDTIRYPVI